MKLIIERDNLVIMQLDVSNADLTAGNDLYIGREDDCHIVLDSPQISRHHAIIKYENNKLNIESLSENSSLKVNGAQLVSSELFENSKIEIINYIISVSDLPKVEQVEEDINLNDPLPENEELVASPEIEEDILESSDDESLDLDSSDDSALELDSAIDDNNPLEVEENFETESDNSFDSPEGGELDLQDEGTSMAFGDSEGIGNDDFNNEQTEVISENDGGLELGDIDGYQDDEENENDSFDSEFESGEGDFASDNEFESNDEFGNDNFGDDGFGEDGGFGSDDGFSSGSDNEATQLVQTFAKYSLKLFGEYAPFDRYLINEAEVFIGRDPEKCQIVLEDPEVSKVHAVIKRTMLNYTLEDLDSSNGIILNGERINRAEISNGDEFLIGDTTFTVTISSDIIEAEKDILMPVEDNQEVEIEEIVEEEVGYDEFQEGQEEEQEKSVIKRILKDPKKKKILYIVVFLVLGVILLDEDKPKLEDDGKKETDKKEIVKKEAVKKAKFSEETIEQLEANYSLAVASFKKGELYQAKEYLDIVMSTDPTFKDSQTMAKLIQEGLDREVRLKEREQTEAERRERQLKIAALVEKAKEAVKNREVEVAKSYFNQIFELDPENIDVPPLRLEIDAYVEDKQRKEQEEALKKARRAEKVSKLAPSKTLYLKGDWFKAIDALEKFLLIENMDEDLTAEGTEMLKDSRNKLLEIIDPLLSKARSYKEGQDLKQAYEIYGDVLKYDPTNEESLNQRDEIFTTLKNRSRRVYREALVAESLSLYSKAKEKFQEVQQISPNNSEYYIKATDKLKNYLE